MNIYYTSEEGSRCCVNKAAIKSFRGKLAEKNWSMTITMTPQFSSTEFTFTVKPHVELGLRAVNKKLKEVLLDQENFDLDLYLNGKEK